MDWAQDKIRYVDFDNKIREFGPQYIHQEWKPLIDAIFAASDPSNEDVQQPLALVEETMRTYNISLANPANQLTNPPTQINSSRNAVRCPASGSSTHKPKRQKTRVSMFFDLAAEDHEEDEDDEDDSDNSDFEKGEGHVWGSSHDSCVRCSGKEMFTCAINVIATRYGGASHDQDTRLQKPLQILEGIPRPLTKCVYIVDLVSSTFTRLQQFNF